MKRNKFVSMPSLLLNRTGEGVLRHGKQKTVHNNILFFPFIPPVLSCSQSDSYKGTILLLRCDQHTRYMLLGSVLCQAKADTSVQCNKQKLIYVKVSKEKARSQAKKERSNEDRYLIRYNTENTCLNERRKGCNT